MYLKEFMEKASGTLSRLYSREESRALAVRLIEEIAGIPRYHPLTEPFAEISEAAVRYGKARSDTVSLENHLIRALERLENGEPVQYILGYEYFSGHKFKVGPGVLIPRPETQELVRLVCRDLGVSESRISRMEKTDVFPRPFPAFRGVVLDVCTGSGCIAHSLAYIFPGARVYGCDNSAVALQIAREQEIDSSRKENEAGKPVFFYCDVLADNAAEIIRQHLPCRPDIIVSNPPYVCEKEKEAMHVNVLGYEPEEALFVPDSDPLRFYEKIASAASLLLVPGGGLYFEINENYPSRVVSLLEGKGFEKVAVFPDINRKSRMISARKPSGKI